MKPREELAAALAADSLPRDRMPGFIDVGIACWKDPDGRTRYGRHYVPIDVYYQKKGAAYYG